MLFSQGNWDSGGFSLGNQSIDIWNFEHSTKSFEPMIEPVNIVHSIMDNCKGGDKEKGESSLHHRYSGRVMGGMPDHHPLT